MALGLGLIVGLFLGEPAGRLGIVGDVYVRLLQMTVLPYVLVSIISGLARLDASIARDIGMRAGMVILFVWVTTMLTLSLMPFAFPQWETAEFFSSSQVAESPSLDFVGLFIPTNIFHSLSNTIVPAVVLFCLLLGAALISVPNKDTFLDLSQNIGDGLMRVASMVTRIAPIGVFAISASASGTLSLDELGRLQVFLWVYVMAWTLLAFVALPFLIHLATPFTYKELMSAAGEAMITAMASGTVLVVLPMIVERCKEILENHGMSSNATSAAVDVMVPTSYSFPSVGSLMGLGFVLFSGWYLASPLGIEQYPAYIILGILTAFGGVTVAIPFLLDYFSMPADQFELYLLGTVVWGRSSMGLAALHGIVVSLLVAVAIMGHLRWRRMFFALGIHLGVTAVALTGAGIAFTHFIPYKYTGDQSFASLQLMSDSASLEIIDSPPALSDAGLGQARLRIIGERGSMRVGYWEESLPYVFLNKSNELVGLDMDLLHTLANDMGIKLELYEIENEERSPAQLLNQGNLDLVLGGIAITPGRASRALFSDSYGYHTIGMVVRDSERDNYSSVEKLSRLRGVRVSAPGAPYYKKALRNLFPNTKEFVDLRNAGEFFKVIQDSSNPESGKPDVFVGSAEANAAWTLLNPQYSMVIPDGLRMRVPMGLMMPHGQLEMAYFLNTWLKIKQDEGLQQQLYEYWIEGKNPKRRKPRWSIMKDVLGWEWR